MLNQLQIKPICKINSVAAANPETQNILYRLEKDQLIEQGTINELAGKVYRSVKRYQGVDKRTYLEIRDDQKVVGVVAEAAVKVASGTFKTEKNMQPLQVRKNRFGKMCFR